MTRVFEMAQIKLGFGLQANGIRAQWAKAVEGRGGGLAY